MEVQLTQVSTSRKIFHSETHKALVEIQSKKTSNLPFSISSPEEAIEALKNEPDYQTFLSILEFISQQYSNFNISSPSPISAQLIHILVSQTIPTFWGLFSGTENFTKLESVSRRVLSSELRLLTRCLQNVTGLNAVIQGLKQYIQLSKNRSSQDNIQSSRITDNIKILLDLLMILLEDDNKIEKIWKDIPTMSRKPTELRDLRKEFMIIVGSGKIIGVSAEAERVIHDLTKDIGLRHWVSDGSQYSLWLARNIANWLLGLSADSMELTNICSELMSKSLRLGHSDRIVKEIITILLPYKHDCLGKFSTLLAHIASLEQKRVIYSILKMCSRDYLSSSVVSEENEWWKFDASSISSVASLLDIIVSGSENMKKHITTWLCSSSGAGVGDGVAIRRSVMAVIATKKVCMESVVENCLQQFGDQLYIRYTPTLQQDVHCQALLLAAGYMYRQSPVMFRMVMKSGAHLCVVSSRLAASSPRTRFLGMVVGEALSYLIDKEDSKMDFKVDEMKTSEAKWYKSLVEVSDSVGTLDYLISKQVVQNSKKFKMSAHKQSEKFINSPKIDLKNVSIEKIGILEESDHDLEPYLKPDSDPEDSDDDPTLTNHNKLIAPVYIRDLISYLRETESYDHQRLGLSSASSLIRRKANFGKEVSENAEELATLLVGIQDKYGIKNFSNMRLEGMIAILIALPSKMGQWLSNTFFEGDYSISQRSSILTTLGLGAREIAGLDPADASVFPSQSNTSLFPSKELPENMKKHYVPQDLTQLDILSAQLTRSIITPMAASLADKLTGPSILKIRTFSSRLEVEKKRPKPQANNLSKIVAESFFFPLAGKFFLHLNSFAVSTRSVIFQPFLLSHFIKTLTLIIQAAGPFTPSLSQITAEFWDLLLGLQASAKEERIVCEALCFAILTLLELNLGMAELVENHGRRLFETQSWIDFIFGGLGEGEEDEKCKILAAGCMVRIQEVAEKYQAKLLGNL